MKNSISLFIEKIDCSITFTKLSNKEWYEFRQQKNPIFEDWHFIMMLNLDLYPKRKLNLAKIYTALFTLFGGHNNYDDYKCTFSYRFKLTISRNGKNYDYGLDMYDMKGDMPYFTYYRPLKEGESKGVYLKAVDTELSEEDMRFSTLAFIAFLGNFIDGYQPFFNQPFYRVNKDGYVIYGFENSNFFVKSYDYSEENSWEEFEAAIEEHENNEALQGIMSRRFWKDSDL